MRRLSSDAWRDCIAIISIIVFWWEPGSALSKRGLTPPPHKHASRRLPPRPPAAIMKEPGNRDTRVHTNPNRQDADDRIRPQGGRGLRALQSLGGEYRRHAGKRDSGTGDLSERRGGAGSADAFFKGTPNSGGEALQLCRLPGNPAQKFVSYFSSGNLESARPFLLFFVLLGSTLLGGCGHKHPQAQVPPPPAQQPTPPAATTGAEKIEVPAGAKPILEE